MIEIPLSEIDLEVLDSLSLEIPNLRSQLVGVERESTNDVHAGIRILCSFVDALRQAGFRELHTSLVVEGTVKRWIYVQPEFFPSNRVDVKISPIQLHSLVAALGAVITALVDYNEASIRTGFEPRQLLSLVGRLALAIEASEDC
jgi:hypothetical protein